MNKSTMDKALINETHRMEKEMQNLINENDRAYQNKEMFFRLFKQWNMKYKEIEKKINQLDKEISHIKNPY